MISALFPLASAAVLCELAMEPADMIPARFPLVFAAVLCELASELRT